MNGSADVLSPLTTGASPKLGVDPSLLTGRIPMEHLKRNCQLFLQVSIDEFRRQLEAFMLTTLDTLERQYREAQPVRPEEEEEEEEEAWLEEVKPDPAPFPDADEAGRADAVDGWAEETKAEAEDAGDSPLLAACESEETRAEDVPAERAPDGVPDLLGKCPLVLKAAPSALPAGTDGALPGGVGEEEGGGGGGPLWCHTCNQSFADSLPFELHVRGHDLDKKCVKCFYCGKTFASFSNLKRHKKIHTGVRPHVCSFCARPFLNRSDLVRHWRIHTGERPYRCDICQHAFKYSFNLKTHQQKYHSID